MEDPDYRVEEPEEQKEEPDTWMEEIPDDRLEMIPEEKAEEKVEEKEEEKKEEGDEGEPTSDEDWKRLLRRGPPGTSMKELLDLLAQQAADEAKKPKPDSAVATTIVPFVPTAKEKPKVVIEELEDDLD